MKDKKALVLFSEGQDTTGITTILKAIIKEDKSNFKIKKEELK